MVTIRIGNDNTIFWRQINEAVNGEWVNSAIVTATLFGVATDYTTTTNTATTIVFSDAINTSADYYAGYLVEITSGNCVGQKRVVTGSSNAANVTTLTVATLTLTPTAACAVGLRAPVTNAANISLSNVSDSNGLYVGNIPDDALLYEADNQLLMFTATASGKTGVIYVPCNVVVRTA